MAAATISGTPYNSNIRYSTEGKLGTSQELPMTNGLIELGEQRTWKFFIQICLALDVIHDKGIVHADLKPSNLLMSGRDYDLRLTDFGVSTIKINQQNLISLQAFAVFFGFHSHCSSISRFLLEID